MSDRSFPRAAALAPLAVALATVSGLTAIGCAPVGGPVDVEAVVSEAGGGYRLDTVTLDGVTNLFGGEHADFTVTGGQDFHLATSVLLTEAEGGNDFDTVVEISRGAPRPVTPSLYFNPLSNRYEAEDFDSLYYLSLLDIFEETFRFFRAAGDTSEATSTRGLVGMYGHPVVGAELPIPILPDADNAAYLAVADAWLALRVHDQDGLPFGMNRGVIAHEFQHRVFFRSLFDGEGFAIWRNSSTGTTTNENGETVTGQAVDNLVLRGVDEGLADVFGVASSGDAAFMASSLVDAPWGIARFAGQSQYRDLQADFAEVATFDDVMNSTLDDDNAQTYCGALTAQQVLDQELQGLSFNYYCVGTVVAKTVFDAAGADIAVMRSAFLPAILAALDGVRANIVAASSQTQLVFDVGWLLEGVAQQLGASSHRDAFCAEVERRFVSVVEEARVPTCRP